MWLDKKQVKSIFLISMVLTSFFVLIEFNYFLLVHQSYLQAANFVSKQLSLPFSFYFKVAFFIVAQCVVHVLFVLCVVWFSIQALYCFRMSSNKVALITSVIWSLVLFLLIAAHQLLFPLSKFSEFTQHVLPMNWCEWIVLFLTMFFVGIMFVNVVRAMWYYTRQTSMALLVLFSLAVIWKRDSLRWSTSSAPLSQPHVIIIGIDSLRPDFIQQFGRDVSMPFLQSVLNESVVFSDALTPLARTFPAWISILSGTYPALHGVRTNLLPLSPKVKPQLLSTELQKMGYFSIYASDETRFSNIDQQFGFDLTVTPPIGLSDFILGTLNDFPISNFVVNTTLGRWLFPNSYANRPVYFTYEPDEFVNELKSRWLDVPRHRPIFLAVHFCLPHFPYLWRNSLDHASDLHNYQASLNRVDEQLRLFFSFLQQQKLLKNSIVVLLSDHGEALELLGDRATDVSLYQQKKQLPTSLYEHQKQFVWNQSAGHGTDVLGLTQYHTLLAFRFYGVKGVSVKPKVVTTPVSLVDIKPTLLDFLRFNPALSDEASIYRGLSLKTFILNSTQAKAPSRSLFLESDFSPESIRTVHPDTVAVAKGGAHLFEILPHNERLQFKEEFLKDIYAGKQYAIIKDEWMLALYPTQNKRYLPVILNLKSGKWDMNLQSEFARNANASALLGELASFYKLDVMSSWLI